MMQPERPPLRALIVDDERIARERLRHLLEADPRIELVGEAADATSALSLVAEMEPDIVYLDIQMRGPGGFEVAAALGDGGPAIVFVTAFDEHAVRAFDANAVDYVLKPVDPDRLQRSTDRAVRIAALRHTPGPESAAISGGIRELLRALRAEALHAERIPVTVGHRTMYVPIREVEWIEAEGNYVRLHLGKRALLIRDSLRQLTERLDPREFVRVHRSAIVNVAKVTATEPLVNGDMKLTLASGATVNASRVYRQETIAALPMKR